MRCHPVFLIALVVPAPGMAQQGPDPEFKPKVQRRAYVGPGPIVAIDEAHGNFHTMNGRYRPLADLLEADGYQVRANEAAFSAERLRGVQVLIVSNAAATSANVDSSEADASGPAFTSAESDALRDWVRGGGSMLLIADHAPFGSAAAILGERFGIHMGTGFVADPAHSETRPTFLVFSAENGLLGDLSLAKTPSELEPLTTSPRARILPGSLLRLLAALLPTLFSAMRSRRHLVIESRPSARTATRWSGRREQIGAGAAPGRLRPYWAASR